MADTTHLIDLRSDTVTRPSAAMRAAMASAEVGDDTYSDDPTVDRLQRRFAEMVGKEAALFVTSGTQGNQVCIAVHTRPGDEVLCDRDSHIIHYEGGGAAALSGVSVLPISGDRGLFTPADFAAGLRPDNMHYPVSRLLLVENTHNRGGGTVWPLAQVQAVCTAAAKAGVARHLDGARLLNAVVASGVSAADYARPFDSLTVCLSKGLGAPVGSIVAGSKEFIARARRVRKLFGGQLRQVGILAAAAEYALDHNIARLADDHANASRLAADLSAAGAVVVEPGTPTNMVFFALRAGDALTTNPQSGFADTAGLVARCQARGVLFNHMGGGRCRLVTHLDVSADQCRKAAGVISEEAARAGR